ncbi:fructose-bisphosphate aldolase class I [Nocardioides ginsengisegetis]|uniref:Probable fructose-bisphosphate aldolase class 1 n=1 Tax=Nocardioides ginsengisegetis TaxID=661491 RepID=A0A7W3IZC6_9ACTN|nr:class I fructose-bisphosphate aldolase [Nocardioides ginsengisegetis]MBA8803417.1 fructose-bisphosphate aldolase class I [Nocardioides ginsengisegetis]
MSGPLEAMARTARELVAPGKGILAADESAPTMAKRLATIGVESTEPVRRAYREILFATPGLDAHISGVILFDETIRQCAADGTAFPDLLRQRSIIPGIKVDGGTRPLAGFPGEVVTEGLDGLRSRLEEYAALGARFAKWRAVLRIGAGLPSATCVEANAHALARYAALAQEAGLVPVVEPEVLMDGAHSIDRCAHVTTEVLRAVYAQLARHRVVLEATLLKPNMVLPGLDHSDAASDEEIAARTIEVARETVPAAVPGLVFLSGGQPDDAATSRLDALNRHGAQPWQLSFSFGRALQAPVLHAWAGDPRNTRAAQAALLHRARLNGAARRGSYRPAMEAISDQPV